MHLNSRFLCVFTPVCFLARNASAAIITLERPADDIGKQGSPACVNSVAESGVDASPIPIGRKSCSTLLRDAFACANGFGAVNGVGHPLNDCTPRKTISPAELSRLDSLRQVRWFEGLTVIVPAYNWVHNIYHYGRQLNFVNHVVSNLHKYVDDAVWAQLENRSRAGMKVQQTLQVVFRMIGYYPNPWHMNMTGIFFNRILQWNRKNFSVDPRLNYLFSEDNYELICFRSAVVLGAEGATDSLQFLNDTEITTSPPDIPHAAISFKEAVMSALRLPSMLPPVSSPVTSAPSGVANVNGTPMPRPGYAIDTSDEDYASITAPSKVVAYAARGGSDVRRFADNDEKWMRRVLKRESGYRKLKLVHLSVPINQSLSIQVENIRDVGFLVGLHGANLVNAMFMKPGAALFEVFPYRYVKAFYLNGGNAGLRYSSHEAENGKDNNCSATRSIFCHSLYRDVVVNLTRKDRDAIAAHIRDGMDYIVKLRAAFPDGIVPIRRSGRTGPYQIDGFYFPPSPVAVDKFPDSHLWKRRYAANFSRRE
jgi:Glycosyltransferase 61